ncbi:hypothetical protein [Celeribacter baekdonensis]|uniref:hypothetical protein n=1 Tax=Celeribacter baekdonensis TaxID=875171 RepID=UPI0030DBE74B|tara:strand:+ start:218889 stop:219200 length:312 start_codon:yes stop_codon:yes gene_type:complete
MIRLTTLALAMLCATQLQAQDLKRADPNRPTDLIAADLGIPEQVFVTCFMNVAPDVDHAPTAARQHDNKAILLPCLQRENAAITNDRLDAVMDHYRPEGPIHN